MTTLLRRLVLVIWSAYCAFATITYASMGDWLNVFICIGGWSVFVCAIGVLRQLLESPL